MVATLPGIKVGLNCTVELDTDEAVEGEGFKSRIEDIRDDTVVIGWPTRRGMNVSVAVGDMAYLTVPTFDSRGQAAPTMYLDGEIVQRTPGGLQTMATLQIRVLAVGRQQQRAHFRLYIKLQPLECAMWHRGFGASEAEGAWRPVAATVTDLSGGGVGLESETEIPEGSRLRLRFPYPMGSGCFLTETRVAKCIPSTAGSRTKYKIGTQFEQIDKQLRERLQRCIHRFQIEQRRRERPRI
ncbi:MAG TPA: PilZ domain-containing protein [Chloroflexota bacterium]|nr:PilZ domain-containing protein [Chloroflexota bacterium]